jgi:hypothetical protein
MPSTLTHKRLFFEGEDWVSTTGSVTKRILANAASNDVSLLFGSGAQARYSVNVPATGYYKVRLVARPTSSADDQIAVRASGGNWLQSTSCAVARGAFAWCDGPVVKLAGGIQDLWLGTVFGGTYELDAFVLVKQ